MALVRIWGLLLVVVCLAGCAESEQWQLSLSAADGAATADEVTLTGPDEWAVAVAHAPRRRAAVISTQRLVSEWPALVGDEPVTGTLGGEQVTVGTPTVSAQRLTFPGTATAGTLGPTSLVLPYDRTLKNFFDLPPAAGWTYTVTFGPTTVEDTTITATLTSPVVAAFEGDRSRSLPTATAIPGMVGPAFLVTLDNRTYRATEITISEASLQGTTLTVTTQNSAPPAGYNRGALFVDGLPTPA